jgi:hypothetical protein
MEETEDREKEKFYEHLEETAENSEIRTNNSIQFNSILYYYLCSESTATRPITDTAQYRYT